MLTTLTGAQAALCVNNNAAAVLLALAATAQGGEVIVSRGELVEIGGSFRMPDVMEISRAKLVEVGTTNRTRSGDYERALSPNTKAILRVHRGNFRIDGFVESPDLLEVSKLAHDANIPVIVDLGHGSLHDLGFPSNDGLPGCVQQCLEKGADLVLGSGDKLLGGPQAGIAVGSKDLIERMRKHPLHRALRIDKLTTAALEVVLHDHLSERTDRVPALAMISKTPENLKSTSERLHATWMDAIKSEGDASRIEMRPSPCVSHVGGGSDAHYQLDSYGLALKSVDRGPNFVLDKLRTLQPPVIARIHEDEIILDLRTVQDDELETLIQQLVTLALS